MATERLAVTLALSLAAGCGPVAERCRAGTLAVAVTLEGGAAQADELDVSIALDGGTAMMKALAHRAGAAAGNVIVEFPRSYPTGSVARVDVTARAAGVVVGTGAVSPTLSGDCQAVTLVVMAVAPPADGSAAVDLAGDGSQVGDGAADDLAAADLSSSPPDLTPLPPDLLPPPPDLSCPGGGVELCFNGLDDDCDGHIDCDDSDCAPVAICVPPTAAPFVYGTEEPVGGACPGSTSGGKVYVKDPTGGGCSGDCRCTMSGCQATFNLTLGCGGLPNTTQTLTSTCEPIDAGDSFSFGAISGTLACAAGGSAAPVTPPTLTTVLSCAIDGAAGGGCSNQQVCVPRGSKQCVTTPTAGATCPANYPTGSTWYSDYSDGRSCSCSCGAAAGCTAPAVAVEFYGKNCGPPGHVEASPYCSSAYEGVKIDGGCTSSTNLVSALTFSGASTVCCQ